MRSFCGFLLINKPSGPTSHDMIDALRRLTGIARIGHAGTLDPFASGLLICAVGREATRRLSEFGGLSKTYKAIFYLGATSDTYDRAGKIVLGTDVVPPSVEQVQNALNKFKGVQSQVPPMYSAKKINGRKLYDLARAGKVIKRQSSKIEIFNLETLNYVWPCLSLKITCSSGTYIRSLAFDLGEVLGCGAYVEELKRTAIGSYSLKRAINLHEITSKNWFDYFFEPKNPKSQVPSSK